MISIQQEIFRFFFLVNFISSCSSNSLWYYLHVLYSHKISCVLFCYLVPTNLNITYRTCYLRIVLLFVPFIFRNLLHVCNSLTINIGHYFKLITCSLDRSILLVRRASFTLLLISVYAYTRFTSVCLCARVVLGVLHKMGEISLLTIHNGRSLSASSVDNYMASQEISAMYIPFLSEKVLKGRS